MLCGIGGLINLSNLSDISSLFLLGNLGGVHGNSSSTVRLSSDSDLLGSRFGGVGCVGSISFWGEFRLLSGLFGSFLHWSGNSLVHGNLGWGGNFLNFGGLVSLHCLGLVRA